MDTHLNSMAHSTIPSFVYAYTVRIIHADARSLQRLLEQFYVFREFPAHDEFSQFFFIGFVIFRIWQMQPFYIYIL